MYLRQLYIDCISDLTLSDRSKLLQLYMEFFFSIVCGTVVSAPIDLIVSQLFGVIGVNMGAVITWRVWGNFEGGNLGLNLVSVNWGTNLSGPNVPIGPFVSGPYVSVSTICLPNVSGHLFSAAIVSELDVSPSFVSGSIVFAPFLSGPYVPAPSVYGPFVSASLYLDRSYVLQLYMDYLYLLQLYLDQWYAAN